MTQDASPMAHRHAGDRHNDHKGHEARNYWLFGLNIGLSAIAMYLVMFTMIDTWGDFRNNLNTAYMTAMMVAPMGVLMLLTMPGMYQRGAVNVALSVLFVVLFVAAFVGMRSQALIDDRQFIASMIPHHSGAILMCRQASITDPDLAALCDTIEQGQRGEIEQMNAILDRLTSR